MYKRFISLIDCERKNIIGIYIYICVCVCVCVREDLKNWKIDVSKCTSTDRATNMQGQYNGFGSWLKKNKFLTIYWILGVLCTRFKPSNAWCDWK
jgi:hypothetical protein